jgi:hypothetical protein
VPAVVLLVLPTVSASEPPPGRSPGVWIATRTNVETLERLAPELTDLFFDARDALVLGGWGSATAAMGWASVEAFERDLAAGAVPPSVRLAMYDPEAWAHTPWAEQRDPVPAMRRFAEVAREHGLRVMMTPHPSLVTVAGAACGQAVGETVVDAYLRCGIPGAAAEVADVVDVQVQALEREPGGYAAATSSAAAQARDANPDVTVLAHLTTAIAPDELILYEAWSRVRDAVDGVYLGMPDAERPEVAAAFLSLASQHGSATAAA